MTNKWKRLALTLVSATLFGVMLTACSGGGGGGSTPSVPSTPSTPTVPVTPADPTSEVISTESTSQSQADENGNYVLTKTYDVTASDVELNSCVVVSDEVYWNEFDGVNRVVSTAAVWRAALETENELVNSLEKLIFVDTDEVIFITFDYTYDATGTAQNVTVQYEEYRISFENVDGVLETTDDAEGESQILKTVLDKLANEPDITGALLKLSQDTYSGALIIVEQDGYTVSAGTVTANDGSWEIVYIQSEEGFIMAKNYQNEVVDMIQGSAGSNEEAIIRTWKTTDKNGRDWNITCAYKYMDGTVSGVVITIINSDSDEIDCCLAYSIDDGELTTGVVAGGTDVREAALEVLLGTGSPSDAEISEWIFDTEKDLYASAQEIKAIVQAELF